MSAAELRRTVDQATLVDLHRRPQWKPLAHAAVVLATYGALVAVIAMVGSLWVQLAAAVLLGVMFVGWFSAIHECVHGMFLDGRRLNHLAGVFWSCPTFLNFSLYRFYHLEHHRHTAVDGDPEPKGIYGTVGEYLQGLTTIWFPIRFLRMAWQAQWGVYPAYVRRPEHRRAVRGDNAKLVTWATIVVACTIKFPETMAFGYWLPLLIYFPMLSVTGLPEHYGCDEGDDVTKNTRSTDSNAVFRYFYWNNNYHAEHHAFPQVPYCNLPRLSGLIATKFKYRAGSFTEFHFDLVRSLARRGGRSSGE